MRTSTKPCASPTATSRTSPTATARLYDPDVFWSMHPGGCNFLFADGSVHFLKTGMDGRTYQYVMTRAGGEIISGDSY